MAEAYNRVRINGTMPGGEVWSINPAFAATGGGAVSDYPVLLGWASSIGGLNTNKVLPPALIAAMGTGVAITEVRTEYYGSDGTLAVAAEFNLPTPATGSGTMNKGFQSSLVLSLLTGRPGRSYRGRNYLPALSIAISPTTLRVDAATTQAIATAYAGWLDAVGDAAAAGGPLRPVVVSKTMGSNAYITTVQVGDILDTQRRRRDSVAEVYASAVVPA